MFLPAIHLGTFGQVYAGAEPSIAVAPDGTVYVVTPLELWRSDDGGETYAWLGEALYLPYDLDGIISMARSFDDGTTWDSIDVTPDEGQRGHIFPVAAVDEAGTVYVVYARDDAAPTPGPDVLVETDRGLERPNVYLQVSTDQGATWAEAIQLNPEGSTALFPWIAAGAKGRIVVVSYENPSGRPPRSANGSRRPPSACMPRR